MPQHTHEVEVEHSAEIRQAQTSQSPIRSEVVSPAADAPSSAERSGHRDSSAELAESSSAKIEGATSQPVPELNGQSDMPKQVDSALREAAQPSPASTRMPPELPKVAHELPPDSGLILVETSHTVSQVTVVSEEVAETPRPVRSRPTPVDIAQEPLQMVETRKDNATPAG